MMLVFSFVEMYAGCEDDMIYVKDSFIGINCIIQDLLCGQVREGCSECVIILFSVVCEVYI